MTEDNAHTTSRSDTTLMVLSGQMKGMSVPLGDGELVLGREAQPPGPLGGDQLLSRRHARIARDPDGRLWLEDLGSTNGTLLNGAPISGRVALQPGDVIELGGSKLAVQGAATSLAAAPPPEAPDEPLRLGGGDWSGYGAGPATSDAVPIAPPAPAVAAGATARRPSGEATQPQRRGSATVQGQVRGIQQRTETYGDAGGEQIWTFRIERYDEAGNRLPPVPVQMRGARFSGSLHEGDEVRVTGRWKDGTLVTDRVQNLTTHAGFSKRSLRGAFIAFLIVVVLIVGGFIVLVRLGDSAFQRSTENGKAEFCQQAEEISGGRSVPGC